MKRILMEWSADSQFATWSVDICEYRPNEEGDWDDRFLGRWHGAIDYGQTKEEEFHFEFRNIHRPGRQDIVDYVGIYSLDFRSGFVQTGFSTKYWRAEGEAMRIYFDNQTCCGPSDKVHKTYYLEITPLYIKKKE